MCTNNKYIKYIYEIFIDNFQTRFPQEWLNKILGLGLVA